MNNSHSERKYTWQSKHCTIWQLFSFSLWKNILWGIKRTTNPSSVSLNISSRLIPTSPAKTREINLLTTNILIIQKPVRWFVLVVKRLNVLWTLCAYSVWVPSCRTFSCIFQHYVSYFVMFPLVLWVPLLVRCRILKPFFILYFMHNCLLYIFFSARHQQYMMYRYRFWLKWIEQWGKVSGPTNFQQIRIS